MIEKYFIRNDLTLKRWRRFKRIRRSMYSAWIFVMILFLSVTAEMWANSKPIVMKFNGSLYFPVFAYHHPSQFGQNSDMVTDYRKIEMKSGDWAIWPLVKWDPFESNEKVTDYPAPPSKDNWMGTDDRGRDVSSRLLYGFRYSIGFSILVWILSYFIGIATGAIMGFMGGKTDMVGQRVVEVFQSMPILLILITLISVFGASMTALVFLTAMFDWMIISLYVRGEFLRLRKREFVEAAKAMGANKMRLIFKHILPNALSPIVTFSPFNVAALISYLAILDYLGFGLPPPTPSWGELLQQAQRYFSVAWWLAVYPSVALFLALVVLNLIGEGVRDAFDPRKEVA